MNFLYKTITLPINQYFGPIIKSPIRPLLALRTVTHILIAANKKRKFNSRLDNGFICFLSTSEKGFFNSNPFKTIVKIIEKKI